MRPFRGCRDLVPRFTRTIVTGFDDRAGTVNVDGSLIYGLSAPLTAIPMGESVCGMSGVVRYRYMPM